VLGSIRRQVLKTRELKKGYAFKFSGSQDGNMDKLFPLHILFAPTGTFQELSMANGWHEEYMDIASRMDELYDRIKPVEIKKKRSIWDFFSR